jgi:L-alanine-DL-glutamate epimerase-like enolase superfamily enzyme
MIVGETQATCYEMAKDFARLWKGKEPLPVEARMKELHAFTAFNATIKSAFDMALYDIAAKAAELPLYRYLGGSKKKMETDLTIGINEPAKMAETAVGYKNMGVSIIKIKLGKDKEEDVERVRSIREAVGEHMILRVDANQGWDYESAVYALTAMQPFNVQFCEQPMRHWDDYKLPALKKISPVPIMADESVFNHHDARRMIAADACSYINIKFAKSGGILEAIKINEVAASHDMHCMMGGMLESRMALSAFAHFATAHDNIVFYDMDTCMLGHKADPVTGGIQFHGFFIDIPETPGIGADVDDAFLKTCERIAV